MKVEKLDVEAGKPVVFDKALLTYDEIEGVRIGKPFLEGVSIQGEVMEHGKGKKIIVFKYKPKKRYRKKTGHRQKYTLVKITGIEEAKPEKREERKVKRERIKKKKQKPEKGTKAKIRA